MEQTILSIWILFSGDERGGIENCFPNTIDFISKLDNCCYTRMTQ